MPFATPIPFAVPSTSPIRIAGTNDPPFRIINLGLEGSVWLSRNSGMLAGQGTPLHPGTSVLWTEKTELYAIADPTYTVNITLTSDVEDWQPDPAAIAAAVLNSGVLVIDNPTLLYSDTITVGTSTPRLDVSRYQSVIVVAQKLVSPASVDISLDSFMTLGGGPTMRKGIKWGSNSSQIVNLRLPAYLRYFGVEHIAGGGSGVALQIVGSHRDCQEIDQQSVISITDIGYLLDTTGLTINNGVTHQAFLPPWFGEIEIDVTMVAGAVGGSSLRVRAPTGSEQRLIPFTNTIAANIWGATARVACMGGSLELAIVNGSGGNFTFVTIHATALTGYGGS